MNGRSLAYQRGQLCFATFSGLSPRGLVLAKESKYQPPRILAYLRSVGNCGARAPMPFRVDAIGATVVRAKNTDAPGIYAGLSMGAEFMIQGYTPQRILYCPPKVLENVIRVLTVPIRGKSIDPIIQMLVFLVCVI